MIFVHASSTPNTIKVRSRSEMGILSRKWRTKLRISARLPGWLENSSFLFFISDRITLARVRIASSFDHRKMHAAGEPRNTAAVTSQCSPSKQKPQDDCGHEPKA